MADFEEVLQDAGEDIRNVFKKNPFLLLCVGVGAVALLLWWIREKNASAAAESETYAFAGYPTISGGGGSEYYESLNADYWQTTLDEMKDAFGEEMDLLKEQHQTDIDTLKDQHQTDIDNLNSSWQDKYDALTDKHNDDIDNLNSSWGDKYDSLLDKIDDSGSSGGYVQQEYPVYSAPIVSTPSQSVNQQSVIDQMKANSQYWHYAADQSTQDSLHDMNVSLGESIGAQYDSATGTWWKNGTPLYTLGTDAETDVTSTGYKDVPNSLVDYDSNMDYQSKIHNAIMTNQGSAVINTLNAQRDAKIEHDGMDKNTVNSHYDKNVDYMALINQAKAQGASQSVIDNLTAQREAKIRGEQMTKYYGDLKN